MTVVLRATIERTCVGCGRRREQEELVRFSGGPAGLRAYLERGEGRGAYLCPDAGCLERTVRRKTLQRALGAELGPLSVQQLRESIQQAVLQKVQRLLGLARRAKRVVAGSRAVSRALQACEGALLVVDAAQGIEAQTLANAYLAVDAGLEIVPVVNKVDLPSADPDKVAQEIEDGEYHTTWLRKPTS